MNFETVKVALGDDYYKGAYFRTVDGDLDYEIPKSQLERWEDAEAAYGAMQDEIEQVMREQADRARALYQERHKDKPRTVPPALEEAYGTAIMRMLQQSALFGRGARDEEQGEGHEG